MKIYCITDYVIDEKIQKRFLELKGNDVDVELVKCEELSSNRAACMDIMHETEINGVNSVSCSPSLIEKISDADGLIVHVTPITREVIDACSNLKVIGVMRGGLDSVDVDYAKEKGITILNTPMRSAPSVADFAVGMIICEMHNIARSHYGVMNGEWPKNFVNDEHIHNLNTQRVGILGFGYIGREVAKRLDGFGCEIVVCDPFLDKSKTSSIEYPLLQFDEFIRSCDVITIHMRLTEATREIISYSEFEKMKSSCYFINTARSGLVNQNAMLQALKEHRIAGAALDVFDIEPLPSDNEFVKLDNVTITSHIAGTSADTMKNSVSLMYDIMKDYIAGSNK